MDLNQPSIEEILRPSNRFIAYLVSNALTPNNLEQPFKLEIGYNKKKEHKYDLGSHARKVMIESKSHTWTEGGNFRPHLLEIQTCIPHVAQHAL